MLALLKKDFRLQLNGIKGKQFLFMMMFSFVFPIIVDIDFLTYFILNMYFLNVPYINEIENRSKAYISILSAPCTRTEFVLSKYITAAISIALYSAIGSILQIILHLIIPNKIASFDVKTLIYGTAIIITCAAIYNLLYFTLGVKYASISAYISSIIYIIQFFIISASERGKDGVMLNYGNIFFIIGIISFILAIILSIFIYNRKDL